MPCSDTYIYCPESPAKPVDVDLGYYSITEHVGTNATAGAGSLRTAQVLCEPGHYCESGVRYHCPPGTFGKDSGLFNSQCSGLCPRSFFCPENSVVPLKCSPGFYSTGGARDCVDCEVPNTVAMDVINSMCRDDRSCCIKVLNRLPHSLIFLC